MQTKFLQRAAKKIIIMKKLTLLFVVFLMTFSSALYSQQRVKASFYADKFHGRKTASGNLYHRDSLTCAHKTLPFGTILKVINPRNNKEVIVKVTDRGPFIKGRSIDLSYAAAKKIGVISHGVASVDIHRLDPDQLKTPPVVVPERIEIHDLEVLKKLDTPMDSLEVVPDNTKVANDSLRFAYRINKRIIIKTA